jgi:hypothetical protein
MLVWGGECQRGHVDIGAGWWVSALRCGYWCGAVGISVEMWILAWGGECQRGGVDIGVGW